MNRSGHKAPVYYRSRISPGKFPGKFYGLSLFDQLYREMDDMLSRMPPGGISDAGEDATSMRPAAYLPAVDVNEEDDKYRLSFELPGMKPEDVEISVADGVLHIQGEKHAKEEQKDDGRSLRERIYGTFSRSMRLPGNVNEDGIEARFEHGVLEVTLPKGADDATRTRRIAISGAPDGGTTAIAGTPDGSGTTTADKKESAPIDNKAEEGGAAPKA